MKHDSKLVVVSSCIKSSLPETGLLLVYVDVRKNKPVTNPFLGLLGP